MNRKAKNEIWLHIKSELEIDHNNTRQIFDIEFRKIKDNETEIGEMNEIMKKVQ